MQDTRDRLSERELAALIQQHRGPLLSYVVRLTGDRHLAEDVVQETLVRVWQRPMTLATHHESVRPWLFTVARNLVTDHRRHKGRAAEVFGSVMAFPVGAHTDATLLAHDMNTALSRLSVDHRTVLLAVYYQGKPLAKIADELSIPLGTVKSRVYYALRALRNIAVELGIAPSLSAAA